MQHFRSAVVLDLAHYTNQSHYVVSVGRTEIADVETREDITALFGEYRFEAVVASQHSAALAFVHTVQLSRNAVEVPSPAVVSFAGRQIHKVLGETAFERVNRHVIVVEDDKQVVFVHRGVVQSLERQAACHSSIADNGDHIAGNF